MKNYSKTIAPIYLEMEGYKGETIIFAEYNSYVIFDNPNYEKYDFVFHKFRTQPWIF